MIDYHLCHPLTITENNYIENKLTATSESLQKNYKERTKDSNFTPVSLIQIIIILDGLFLSDTWKYCSCCKNIALIDLCNIFTAPAIFPCITLKTIQYNISIMGAREVK